jgi:cytoskeletal protein CcmA (bactofilin family)
MGVVRTTLGFLGLGEPVEREPVPDEPTRRERGYHTMPSGHAMPEGGTVTSRLVFRGELSGEGDFHILGKFEGEITVSGRVVVGEGALVDANITAATIVIGGTVRGNLSATSRVEILPSGVLTGTLRTGSLAAADGASVKGEVWIDRAGQAGTSD